MNNVRRIVTGLNDQGRSIILMDTGITDFQEIVPGLRAADIWRTETTPADNASIQDNHEREFTVEPTRSGTIFRYLEVDPLFGVDDPGWHATDTLDYVMVAEGEIYCVMEQGEVHMKAGDLLVQRGTNHGWVNRSNEKCVLVGVMVSAIPLS